MKQSIESRVRKLESNDISSQIDYSKFAEILEKAKDLPGYPRHAEREKWVKDQIGEPPTGKKGRQKYWNDWAILMMRWDSMDTEHGTMSRIRQAPDASSKQQGQRTRRGRYEIY